MKTNNKTIIIWFSVVLLLIFISPVNCWALQESRESVRDIQSELTSLWAEINALRPQVEASSNQLAHQFFQRAEETASDAEAEYRTGNNDNALRLIDRARDYLQRAESELRRPSPEEGNISERLSRDIVRLRDRIQESRNSIQDYMQPSVQVLLERAQEDLSEATEIWQRGSLNELSRAAQLISRGNQLLDDAINLALGGRYRFGTNLIPTVGVDIGQLRQEWNQLYHEAQQAVTLSPDSNAERILNNALLLSNQANAYSGGSNRQLAVIQFLRSMELLKLVIRLSNNSDTSTNGIKERAQQELNRLEDLLNEVESRVSNQPIPTYANFLDDAQRLLDEAETAYEEGRYNQVFWLLQAAGRFAIRTLNNVTPPVTDANSKVDETLKELTGRILPELKNTLEKNKAGDTAWIAYRRAEELSKQAQTYLEQGNTDRALKLIQAARIYAQKALAK